MNEPLKAIHLQWPQFLQNPIWYVATIAVLAVLTSYVPYLWWVAGLTALIWGTWLLRQIFGSPDEKSPNAIDLMPLETCLEQILAYKTQIERVIKTTANNHNRFYLEQLSAQLDTCTRAVKEMVQRLISLRRDTLIGRDLKIVPEAIATLEARLLAETNAVTASQLEFVLSARKEQLTLLDRLQAIIIRTELQLEHTLSVFGAIYSQVLIGQSTDEIADYRRLSASVDEEMRRLADQLEALSEVKGDYRSAWANQHLTSST